MPEKSAHRRQGRGRRKRRSRTPSRPPESSSRPRSRTAPGHDAKAQRRIDTAFLALSDNSRKAYRSAWAAWQRWAAEHGYPPLPATADAVAEYLQARHAGDTAPATIRVARTAISKAHRVSDLTDPTTDNLCRDLLRRIGREGRNRGRGQVAGVGWNQVEDAAALAEGDGTLRGLRDAAIIRLMSDTLARISEVAALQCSDVEPDPAGGSVHIRASKTDQRGAGFTRFIGPATWAAASRYLAAAGHTTGPLFRRVLRGGHSSAAPLAAASIRDIVRERVAAVADIPGRIGGHSLRVGSARELAADGASMAELLQAGGWRSSATLEIYIRHEAAARGPVARRRYQVGKDPAHVRRAPVPPHPPDPSDFGWPIISENKLLMLSFPAVKAEGA